MNYRPLKKPGIFQLLFQQEKPSWRSASHENAVLLVANVWITVMNLAFLLVAIKTRDAASIFLEVDFKIIIEFSFLLDFFRGFILKR